MPAESFDVVRAIETFAPTPAYELADNDLATLNWLGTDPSPPTEQQIRDAGVNFPIRSVEIDAIDLATKVIDRLIANGTLTETELGNEFVITLNQLRAKLAATEAEIPPEVAE